MRTVVIGDRPPVVEEWLEQRRALGQDLFDEVWEGDYHVAPAPHGRHGLIDYQVARLLGPLADRAGLRGSGPCNVGGPENYRVPDQAYFRDASPETYHATAELVVEIVSPGDESRSKFDFYFRAGVSEVLIVDPEARTAEWHVNDGNTYAPAEISVLLGLAANDLSAAIDWPS